MTSSDSHKTAAPRIKPVKPGALRAVDEGVFVEGEDDLEAVESCDDSRIGSWEVCDAIWRSVHFSGCKIGYLNLRDAEVSDLKFTNCVIVKSSNKVKEGETLLNDMTFAPRVGLVRIATSPAMRIACVVCAGIHTARPGGTTQVAPRAVTRITPVTAWISCARACRCGGTASPSR